MANALNLPEKSYQFFVALAKDAGNWSGTPWFDGNVCAGRGASAMSQTLTRNGLILSLVDPKSGAYAQFTAEGCAAAAKVGVDLYPYYPEFAPKAEETTDMTVTVKKGAGRPGHAERTSRHAQRTPLPPKAGKATDPAEVETTTRSRRKSVTGSEESPNPTRPARARTAAAGAAPAAEKPMAKATRGTRKPAISKAAKAPAEDFPGRAKVMRLLDGEAQGAGWTGSFRLLDEATGAGEVVLSKDGETMTWWIVSGKQDPNQNPKWSDGSRTVTMKNISAILAQATGERLTVRPASARRAPAARKGADTPQKQLPFDPAGASDDEVVKALRGTTITWTNRLSQAVESAVVATKARIKVETHPATGARMVTFNDPTNTGTRTVLLERLLTVK